MNNMKEDSLLMSSPKTWEKNLLNAEHYPSESESRKLQVHTIKCLNIKILTVV